MSHQRAYRPEDYEKGGRVLDDMLAYMGGNGVLPPDTKEVLHLPVLIHDPDKATPINKTIGQLTVDDLESYIKQLRFEAA